MRRRSLALRLILSAALWSAVALVAAALIITSLYRQTVERAFDERLTVYLQTLVGQLATQRPDALTDPGNLGEQRFENTYSGWYWQVRREDGTVVLASRSLYNDAIATWAESGRREVADGVASFSLTDPVGQSLRALEQRISLAANATYFVTVAGDAGAVQAEISNFRQSVFLTLAAFGIGLVLATTIQIRWGLAPLDRIRRALAALRSGKETRFGGPFPSEIEPLAKELNALLDSNQEIIERARTQVGNLAHALKTPLSVITNEARAQKSQLADKVAEQAEIMRTQVNHYLDRARIAARSKVIGAITDVEPVVSRLVRAMTQIHGDRDLDLTANVPKEARFRGEKQDFEEIVGNLVDNACKWAKSEVTIAVDYTGPRDERAPGRLTVNIDDDGPGLGEGERAAATERGRRLDETKPGSGLGLSIVTELVALYEGKFSLARSPAGGLRAALELPAA